MGQGSGPEYPTSSATTALQGSGELARRLEPWNLDAFGRKGHAGGDTEPCMAVDYMDASW